MRISFQIDKISLGMSLEEILEICSNVYRKSPWVFAIKTDIGETFVELEGERDNPPRLKVHNVAGNTLLRDGIEILRKGDEQTKAVDFLAQFDAYPRRTTEVDCKYYFGDVGLCIRHDDAHKKISEILLMSKHAPQRMNRGRKAYEVPAYGWYDPEVS